MKLTIAELARAVGKSDNYVRQHIRRKHLIVQKQGRSVFVALNEAERWARDRRLPFAPPAQALAMAGSVKGRAARMTVLVSMAPDSEPRNMFTLIRHRLEDSLGPWTGGPDETWAHADLEHGLRLYTLNASLENCNGLIDRILSSGTLRIDSIEIRYSLEPAPRCHWAYRDLRPNAEASVSSPFSRNSAEITEYWSFDEDLRRRWLEVVNAFSGKSPLSFSRLGFPLNQRSDRVGNLMIAGALDAVTCDLAAHRDQTLRLSVQADALRTGRYRATVWASHSEDMVLRREISVTSEQIVIKLASDVDHIGFSIYRATDGQCVDHMQEYLIKDFRVRLSINDQPTISIKDHRKNLIQEVTPSGITRNILVSDKRYIPYLDRGIRREWLHRRSREQEDIALKEGDLVRFSPTKFDDAASHFVHLLGVHSEGEDPLYLADPYFMEHSEGDDVAKLFIQVFATTRNRPLRILCGKIKDGGKRPWWSEYPKVITKHVEVRAFFDHKNKPWFHDRYLITPEREILITNSFNGWRKHGVTFARQSYGVYRAEAEKLWSMDAESSGTNPRVQEIG